MRGPKFSENNGSADQNFRDRPLLMAKIILVDLHVCGVVFMAAERIVGARGKYKKWGPYYRLCKGGGLGARP